jgi:Tfp pilus assembly protein PilX
MQLEKRAPRGNALMLTLVAIAVLMVLVVGAIQFTNSNREAAAERLRGERVGACADSARRHVLSRLKQFHIKELRILEARLIDASDPDARSQLVTGHYGSTDAEDTAVVIDSSTMGEATKQARDIANTVSDTGTLGGKYYRVVVKCQEPEPSGRESEVEFLFRYGL